MQLPTARPDPSVSSWLPLPGQDPGRPGREGVELLFLDTTLQVYVKSVGLFYLGHNSTGIQLYYIGYTRVYDPRRKNHCKLLVVCPCAGVTVR